MATITGTSGDDNLHGGPENDTIKAFEGDDVLVGRGGDDWLYGGPGADRMYGGLGNDIYFVNDPGDLAQDKPGGGIDEVRSSVDYTLGLYFENLTLRGAAAIDGKGNARANVIKGNDAANVLAGREGDDRLDGQGGADTMWGGPGDDVYVVRQPGDRAIEGPDADGFDTVESFVTFTLGSGIEKLDLVGDEAIDGKGNALDNEIRGNRQENVLRGARGDDEIYGGLRDDTLYGGRGNDSLDGGQNDDVLYGGAGKDDLFGGAGTDILFGGAGDDFLDGGDSGTGSKIDEVHGGEGNDTINIVGRTNIYFDAPLSEESNVDTLIDYIDDEYQPGEATHRFFLDSEIFGLPEGELDPAAFVQGDEAETGEHRIIYNPDAGTLSYDPDGTGATQPILFANIGADHTLIDASYFIVF